MIFIIISVFNRWGFTKACLNSLITQNYKQFTIIVVDHGSTDGTAFNIENEFPEVVLIKGSDKLWWAGATNLGVSKAISLSGSENDLILTLNNDLEVNENYLNELLNTYERFKPCFVGSISVNISETEKVVYLGTYLNNITAKYKAPTEVIYPFSKVIESYDYINSDLLTGRGTLIPKKAFLELGLYDEKSFPHYMADEDFSLRGKNAGYKIVVSTGAVVKSHVSATGVNFRQGNKSFKNFLNSLSSIRSANNLKYRFNWAKKHGKLTYFYFLFDICRIFGSYVKNLLIK